MVVHFSSAEGQHNLRLQFHATFLGRIGVGHRAFVFLDNLRLQFHVTFLGKVGVGHRVFFFFAAGACQE